jgi:hypothetical protein
MHESKHSVLASRLAAKENWSLTNSERDLARARTRELPMVVLCLVAFCTFPSANHAQVPVYEVTPVESTIKFGVESSVPIKGPFRQMERMHEVFVHRCEERHFGHRNSSGQREHR